MGNVKGLALLILTTGALILLGGLSIAVLVLPLWWWA